MWKSVSNFQVQEGVDVINIFCRNYDDKIGIKCYKTVVAAMLINFFSAVTSSKCFVHTAKSLQ